MTTVVLAGNGFGGIIDGNFGTYQVGSDGTFTVDARDAPSLLALGMSYVKNTTGAYTLPAAALAATVGQIHASGTLSNGAVTITNQPDVARPVKVIIGTGTLPISAGVVTVTYTGNDGTVDTDALSCTCAASGTTTQYFSRGAVSIATMVVSGLSGGLTPFIHMDTIAAVSVPLSPGAIDFSIFSEIVDGAAETVGTLLTGVLGSITPTTAPDGTHIYSFGYSYVAPVT